MSKTEWFILWLVFIAYLFLGASVFYSIERNLEEEKRKEAESEQKELKVLLERQYPSLADNSIDDLAHKVVHYCVEKSLPDSNVTVSTEPYKWTYYNAFFFALTTISTIGYGNLVPTSDESRLLVILYSLIGIPFTGIVLAYLGEFFGSVFLRAHHRYKTHVYESRINLILDILLYLIPGMAVFILAPTFLFQYFEDWSFVTSVYYAYVTLTTIGFGDLVAGQSANESPGDMAYKIFLLIWIMFGLGYLVMILGFISRAMKSKRINRLEQKLANTIKQTQSKIWNEFIQDINYIRRALNEAYINKVKPVYRDRKPLLLERRLTVSCPEFSEWPELMKKSDIEALKEQEQTQTPRRRRAFSENDESLLASGIPRVMSEGALGDIDMAATFRDQPRPSLAAIDQDTEELLANLVSKRRLSMYDDTDTDEGGIHLFTDNEILQSEQISSRGSPTPGTPGSWRGPVRSRASSYAPYLQEDIPVYDRQKTWSGVDSLHTRTMLKNMRSKSRDWEEEIPREEKEKPSPANSFRRLSMAALNFFSGTDKQKKKKLSKEQVNKSRKTGNIFNKSSSNHRLSLQENDFKPEENNISYLTQTRRPSLLDVLATSNTGGANTPMSPVLEQTSLADFIRVMSTLRRLEEQQTQPGDRSRHPSLSYLFNPPPAPHEVLRARERKISSSTGNLSRGRRMSQTPQRPPEVGFRPRAVSISQGPSHERRISHGRFTPPSKSTSSIPPAVVVTSPEGRHRFSVHNVPSQPRNEPFLSPRRRRGDSLSEVITKP